MIARPQLYKCPKCGYKKECLVGDVIRLEDLYPKCPVCEEDMKRANLLDKILYKLDKNTLTINEIRCKKWNQIQSQ